MKPIRSITAVAALLALGACAVIPPGPSIMALPGSGKGFDQFRADDQNCRNFASSQVGGASAQQAANDSTARGAVLGGLLGTALGAAVGGSHGAAIGGGTGLLFGSAASAGVASDSAHGVQRRYDQGYLQCMYASGHRVPVSGRLQNQPTAVAPGRQAVPQYSAPQYSAPQYSAPQYPSQPAPQYGPQGIPPPPPGTPPPPPPGVQPG